MPDGLADFAFAMQGSDPAPLRLARPRRYGTSDNAVLPTSPSRRMAGGLRASEWEAGSDVAAMTRTAREDGDMLAVLDAGEEDPDIEWRERRRLHAVLREPGRRLGARGISAFAVFSG